MTGPSITRKPWSNGTQCDEVMDFFARIVQGVRPLGCVSRCIPAPVPPRRCNPTDLAGNGELYAGTSPATIGDMVTQLRRQVDRKQLPLPARLVGISMGGMVASQWAAVEQEVKSAVLINTSMRPYGKFYQRLRPHSYLSLVSLLWPHTRSHEARGGHPCTDECDKTPARARRMGGSSRGASSFWPRLNPATLGSMPLQGAGQPSRRTNSCCPRSARPTGRP